MMIVLWIVTSALLANLYREFCDNLKDDDECNETDERFTATPVLGFICFVAWVRTLCIHLFMEAHKSYSSWLTCTLVKVNQIISYIEAIWL